MERVERLLAVARRVADAGDALGSEARALARARSQLSPEGVELALTQHLETHADFDGISRWVRPSTRAWIVLSANVLVAPLRALVLACASAPRVFVRPSRRDEGLTELLVRALADPSVSLVDEIDPRPGDQVHAYGSDETLSHLRAALPRDVVLRGHGTGFGVAVLQTEEDARKLAEDVVPFDQRGCLSPRIAFFVGSPRAAERVAASLEQALQDTTIPAGRLSPEEAHARRTFLDTAAMLGWAGDHVALTVAPTRLELPPLPRVVSLVCVPDEAAAHALLGPSSRFVTTLGGQTSLGRAFPRARRARLGELQRPPLDGPVDLRG